jgi:phage-related protein
MRPLRFVGDSLEVLRELPEGVKDEIGFALERVQRGKMPENAKPRRVLHRAWWKLFPTSGAIRSGPSITVKFPKAIYVLHVFQKKSKRGIATPRHEMKLVEKRLAQVVVLEKPSRKSLG